MGKQSSVKKMEDAICIFLPESGRTIRPAADELWPGIVPERLSVEVKLGFGLFKALEALGYFARDSTKSPDLVLSDRMLMPLLEQFNDKTKLSIIRKATRTLSNLCQGKPQPQFDQVKSALLPLAHLILIDDKKVLKYACSALLNLTVGTKDIIQTVIDAGVFPHLFELLLYPSPVVSIPALCTVDNIISYGDDIDIQVLADSCS
ncbi:unnamed protein product [Fraxinus pennsylvanica]|uniref:Uncharacterized protein n=1 Tax=Fraxinus pennsylvanica TaxID=56036 RepID=A0AAD1ZZ54_9LAMI|nr:unnamed protein product [Fraxinus pennsylvanica]